MEKQRPFRWHKNPRNKDNQQDQDNVEDAYNEAQLERLKKRRLEKQTASEATLIEKYRQGDTCGDWHAKETAFHLEQAFQKCLLRVKEGRARPFDLLMVNTFRMEALVSMGNVSGVDTVQFAIFVEDPVRIIDAGLAPLIHEHLEVETDAERLMYWQAILALSSLKPLAPLADGDPIKEDLEAMLQGKDFASLQSLQAKLESVTRGMDPDYKVELVARIQHRKWAQRVRELNDKFVTKLKRELPSFTEAFIEQKPVWPTKSHTVEDDGSMAMYLMEARRQTGPDEVPFNIEADDIPNESTGIKPLFFNRARTAFEWNKYNQTHYDADNPPPKTLQGFRFNIFYPKLAESTNTPQYTIEPDPKGDGKTRLLWFRADGYRSLAFRIPESEWEVGARRGFRCTFDRNGILKLHFWFRKAHFQ